MNYVVRLKYEASHYRLNEATGSYLPERPGGWGYMTGDGGCSINPRAAHRFASEADAYTYLASLPNEFFRWTKPDEYRIEPLDEPVESC